MTMKKNTLQFFVLKKRATASIKIEGTRRKKKWISKATNTGSSTSTFVGACHSPRIDGSHRRRKRRTNSAKEGKTISFVLYSISIWVWARRPFPKVLILSVLHCGCLSSTRTLRFPFDTNIYLSPTYSGAHL